MRKTSFYAHSSQLPRNNRRGTPHRGGHKEKYQEAEGTEKNKNKSLFGGFGSYSQALGSLGHRYSGSECEILIMVAGSMGCGLVGLQMKGALQMQVVYYF